MRRPDPFERPYDAALLAARRHPSIAPRKLAAGEGTDIWGGHCPVCGQDTFTLVGRLDDGRVTLRCGAGCDVSTALESWAGTANGNGHPAVEGGKLRRLDLARMVREEPPPVPWVVEGLVVRGMLTVLNGREGEGKSLLSMALAAGVATGQDEAGLACHRGRVVIVDAENGEGEIHRRVRTLELPSVDVVAYEAQGFDLRSDLAELERILEAHRPNLLVLDSYRSLWGGEENDSREVAGVLDPLRNLVRRYEAGTLMLHHSGRANGAYRGSSAIGASAELGFKLARADDDPDPTRCYLEAWKCRPAQKPPKRWLRLSVERGRVFIDAAEPVEREIPEPEAPVREQLTPRVLAALTDKPQTRAAIARAVGREPKDRSVGRVLEELTASRRARRTDEGWQVARPLKGGCHPGTPSLNPVAEPEIGVAGLVEEEEGLPPPATPDEEAEAERIRGKFNLWGEAA
jgi:AAA domain